MTGPGDDSQKHKSDDAAKYLAESFFGLNLNPADVGGELLFDDYDALPGTKSGGNDVQASASLDESLSNFSSADAGDSGSASIPNRFEENLDDLIVFADDEDEDDLDDEEEEDEEEDDEEDDENFDFGDEEDDDEDDEEDDLDEDFEEDDEDEEDEDDELDDADLDFGNDVIAPAAAKTVPAATDSRGGRPEERSAGRGGRSQESSTSRSSGREVDRSVTAKAADTSHKSPPSDEDYWNELDGWVWDDESSKTPAAKSEPQLPDRDEDPEDVTGSGSESRTEDDDDAPKRRRSRRRGGRGRGRREAKDTTSPKSQTSGSTRDNVDFDDDFSEILFEEDQEDFVSVSAGSAKAQRRIPNDPEPAGTARPEQDDDDDEEDVGNVDRSESGGGRSRRGRRGQRGRGRERGREEGREPVRPDVRQSTRSTRPAAGADEVSDDVESDFGDQDDDAVQPRRREESRSERPRTQERQHGQRSRPPRDADPAERSRRQPEKEPRSQASGDAGQSRRGPRPARVAAEFQDIPTWEEAIASLAIRTPSEEHARRAESRGRRDGGRPPRRRNSS